ncbi:hypothetical protein [Lentibacillus sediminis]|uniref:hypothetical protein n=1 Tax=Lentibacillus sediminis TaxID=1940529 RepID=UPI000C1BBC05|nr:hypothetical protein [Lentibacillus sediminis]
MKKSSIFSAVGALGAVGAAAAGYFLKDKDNRQKMKERAQQVTDRLKNSQKNKDTTFEDAGVPDQAANNEPAQLENSKMVSEGSQFGVQYYNDHKEENTSEKQQN